MKGFAKLKATMLTGDTSVTGGYCDIKLANLLTKLNAIKKKTYNEYFNARTQAAHEFNMSRIYRDVNRPSQREHLNNSWVNQRPRNSKPNKARNW